MNRKEFIKTCGFSCMALAGLAPLLLACTSTKYIQGSVSSNKIKVAKLEFIDPKNKKQRAYIIVKVTELNYPIVLYRVSENDFTALLLQCSHQNMELNVNGNLLTCSAHGSEFNNKGEVVQGPAEQSLKRYLVTYDLENIHIHLI